MEKRYSCPECGVVLNPGQKIILLGHRNGVDLLFAFHPEPGNYEMDLPPGAVVREGEVWEFVCPVCHESLRRQEKLRRTFSDRSAVCRAFRSKSLVCSMLSELALFFARGFVPLNQRGSDRCLRAKEFLWGKRKARIYLLKRRASQWESLDH